MRIVNGAHPIGNEETGRQDERGRVVRERMEVPRTPQCRFPRVPNMRVCGASHLAEVMQVTAAHR